MISYEVIVHKEHVYRAPITPPFQVHTNTQRPYPDIKNQTDLDKFWAESQFQKGDYVTYMPKGGVSETSLSSVYQIIATQTDFTKMEVRNYIPYHPVLIKITSLQTTLNTGRWERWDDIRNLRKLTEEEIDATVRPVLDRVRSNSQS